MQESEIIRYSAPGKLFFLGEYGVLAGGWTLVAAMSRRVQACKLPVARGYKAIGAGSEATLDLPRSVLASISKSEEHQSVANFETDVRSFFEGPQKLGLGSSAASVVALSAAAMQQDQSVDTVFETALAAHRLLQNGRGSGADVAASTYGGLLGYRLETATKPFDLIQEQLIFENERPLLETRVVPGLVWPDELEFRAVWTGKSASSTALIGRIEEAWFRNSGEITTLILEISKTAEAGIHALNAGDASGFMQIVARADGLMGLLGDVSGASIITEQHRVLRNIAEKHGVVAKPSGAGGGDFSLRIGMRDAPWSSIERALPAGCMIVDLQLDAQGVRRDQAALALPS